MRWIIKDPFMVNLSTRRKLFGATPTWKNDYMREAMQICKRGKYLAIALFKGSTLIGWAMLDFRLSRHKSVRTYVYVKSKFRRRGYGKKIIAKANSLILKMGRTISVLPHDPTSRSFFKAIGITKQQVARNYHL